MEITPDIIKKLLTNLVTPEFPELIHNYGIIVQDYLGTPLAQIVVFCREKTYEKEYEIIFNDNDQMELDMDKPVI